MAEYGSVADIATAVASRGPERQRIEVNAALRDCEDACRTQLSYLRGHKDYRLFAEAVLIEVRRAAIAIRRAERWAA